MVEVVFRIDLPQGHCVAVAIPEEGVTADLLAALDPEEVAFLRGLPEGRQATFAAGRAALRMAIAEIGLPLAPILSEPRGGPRLPAGVLGSISHKRRLAVAMAAAAAGTSGGCALGVDLEEERSFRFDISRRVLTPEELTDLGPLTEPERTRAVLARFCLKEAFYKAANGFVGRMITFQEVAVAAIAADGDAHFAGRFFAEQPLVARGWVGQPHPGYILGSVSACTGP